MFEDRAEKKKSFIERLRERKQEKLRIALEERSRNVKRFRLFLKMGIGDSCALTMALHALHTQYRFEYQVGLDVEGQELFEYSPYVCNLHPATCETFRINHRPYYHDYDKRPMHLAQALCEEISGIIGRPLQLWTDRPEFWIPAHELLELQDFKNAVLINAGYRDPWKTKWAGTKEYQLIVDWLLENTDYDVVQVGKETCEEHHPRLDGAIDLVDQTSLRDLLVMAYHSQFCVGPISSLMWICSGVETPYLCAAGAYEPEGWASLPNVMRFSALGELDCCREKYCGNRYLEPPHISADYREKVCTLPVVHGNDTIASCHVGFADKVISFLETHLNTTCQQTEI